MRGKQFFLGGNHFWGGVNKIFFRGNNFLGRGKKNWGGESFFGEGQKIFFLGGNHFLGRGKKQFFRGESFLGRGKKIFLPGNIGTGEHRYRET